MIEKDVLIELYVNKKLSQKEIGELFNCDRKNVTYYLKKYDIPRRTSTETKKINGILNDISIDEVLQMIDKGMLVCEIAKEFNVSRGCIGNLLKKNGYNMRNHKNATRKQSEFMKYNNPVEKNSKRSIEVINKVSETKRIKYINMLNSLDVSKLTFRQYSRYARHYAYSYIYDFDVKGLNIDHIFSVKDGYINKIPITLISHKNNLRLITKLENSIKNSKSLITLDEFYKNVGVQRLSKPTLNEEKGVE